MVSSFKYSYPNSLSARILSRQSLNNLRIQIGCAEEQIPAYDFRPRRRLRRGRVGILADNLLIASWWAGGIYTAFFFCLSYLV